MDKNKIGLDKIKILKSFGDRWASAKDDWFIAEGKKKQERLLKWVIKKYEELYERV